MAPSVQRRIKDATQRLKGRRAFVFEIQLVPQSAGPCPPSAGIMHFEGGTQSLLKSPRLMAVKCLSMSCGSLFAPLSSLRGLKGLVSWHAEGIPTEIKQASFLLQRQSKLQSTELTNVDDGTAKWTQILKQASPSFASRQWHFWKEQLSMVRTLAFAVCDGKALP